MSKSIWGSFSQTTDFPKLEKTLNVDVAIIGGGITGITTAQLLSERGFSVCVLEARKIGGGSTSDSTGNLYTTIDHGLSAIRSKYGQEEVRQVVASRKMAIDQIENNNKNFQLDCDFQRVPMFVYSDNPENSHKINDELNTVTETAQQISAAQPEEVPFTFSRAVKMNDQVQINPLLYVQQLAKIIKNDTCQIFENTRVTKIDEKDDHVFLNTTGGTVKADQVVHATHTPKGVRLSYHTVLGPYREYGVAAKLISENFPAGIFWGYFGEGDKYSVRTYRHNDQQFIIAVGRPHKVGQAENNQKNIEELVLFLKARFDIGEITHRWGGQHYRPADKLPYIGKKSHNSRIYLATGFSTDGLVYGTLSAKLIADEMAGLKNPYAELYKAARFSPTKSAKEFLKENLNTAGEMIKDLISKGNDHQLQDMKTGEGIIISKGGHKITAQKNERGEVLLFSAFCTHLGCVVHWNHAEKTWDCPCHGSRFDEQGCVLEGPALHPLSRIAFKEGDADSEKRE